MKTLQEKAQLKDLIIGFIGKIKVSEIEAKNFFTLIRKKILDTYTDLAIPEDTYFYRLIQYDKLTSLFTFTEEYEIDEISFYKLFFKDLVLKERSSILNFQEFAKLLQVFKSSFEEKFQLTLHRLKQTKVNV